MGNPGQLRERAQFQKRTPDQNDDLRGPWDDGIQVWAQIVPLKGSEPVLEQRLLGIQPLAVTIRYSAATSKITSAWRMVWRGQAYSIKAPPAPDTARRWISIMAEADQTSG